MQGGEMNMEPWRQRQAGSGVGQGNSLSTDYPCGGRMDEMFHSCFILKSIALWIGIFFFFCILEVKRLRNLDNVMHLVLVVGLNIGFLE